jgi:hypothetical protein
MADTNPGSSEPKGTPPVAVSGPRGPLPPPPVSPQGAFPMSITCGEVGAMPTPESLVGFLKAVPPEFRPQ